MCTLGQVHRPNYSLQVIIPGSFPKLLQPMTENVRLDPEKTYATILAAARAHRFVSYGDLAAASGVPWPRARHLVPQHLGQLVAVAHERDWPLPPHARYGLTRRRPGS